ncbi:MAG: metalloregulator ArsR/SmtB family transcription factor [Acidobacteriota bacterium]|nr:metalloregulator ArsR/SmtB family transcription factor [Acidobacteriota bacterium]
MAGFLKALRLLGDEGRVRILRLLKKEELSVAELQEILGMGQSRISMQLSQLKQAGFVEVRRAGQKSLYRLTAPSGSQAILTEMIRRSSEEIAAAAPDDEGLRLVLRKRKDKLRGYFDELAGRFGRNYVPGRSWKGLAEMLLRLLPPLVIADLGAGEGTLALMLAQRAEKVIAVDSSGKMVEYGADVARRNGVKNLEYRLGDLEELPLKSGEVDLALLHQSLHHALHPRKAVEEARRILKPGGRIVILDLLKHGFDDARELYADVWLGFSQVELIDLLRKSHFRAMDVSIVHREEEAPHFETLMAIAEKPR